MSPSPTKTRVGARFSPAAVHPQLTECSDETSKDDAFDKVTMLRNAAIARQDRSRSVVFTGFPRHPKLVVNWIFIAGSVWYPKIPHTRSQRGLLPPDEVVDTDLSKADAHMMWQLCWTPLPPANVNVHHNGCRGGEGAASPPWLLPVGACNRHVAQPLAGDAFSAGGGRRKGWGGG
jgi:hypothetical protein